MNKCSRTSRAILCRIGKDGSMSQWNSKINWWNNRQNEWSVLQRILTIRIFADDQWRLATLKDNRWKQCGLNITYRVQEKHVWDWIVQQRFGFSFQSIREQCFVLSFSSWSYFNWTSKGYFINMCMNSNSISTFRSITGKNIHYTRWKPSLNLDIIELTAENPRKYFFDQSSTIESCQWSLFSWFENDDIACLPWTLKFTWNRNSIFFTYHRLMLDLISMLTSLSK